jgi:hypothetical protein
MVKDQAKMKRAGATKTPYRNVGEIPPVSSRSSARDWEALEGIHGET